LGQGWDSVRLFGDETGEGRSADGLPLINTGGLIKPEKINDLAAKIAMERYCRKAESASTGCDPLLIEKNGLFQ
jgi:hypothetical protein